MTASNKIFPFVNQNSIRRALIKEAHHYGLPAEFIELITLSFNSAYTWGYNGANIINDKYYPNLMSWLHDFMWSSGAGGKESDVIFRYVAEKTWCTKRQAKLYYNFVRIGWSTPFIGYKAKHKKKGNVRNLTPIELKCYEIARNYY